MSGTTSTDLGQNAQALIDALTASTNNIVTAITALQTEQSTASASLLTAINALTTQLQNLDVHTKEHAAIVEFWHEYGNATSQLIRGVTNDNATLAKLSTAIINAHNAAVTGVTS